MEVAGKGGSITCTNLTAGVKSWKLDLKGEVLETTDYGDSGHRTYIAGLDGWTGSCEVNWDATNKSLVIGAVITDLIFTIVSATTYYTGATAIVTGISISSSVEGLVTMSVSFQGSGTCELTAP
jgi:predicted secreted protein